MRKNDYYYQIAPPHEYQRNKPICLKILNTQDYLFNNLILKPSLVSSYFLSFCRMIIEAG